jgi:hypothetical protein
VESDPVVVRRARIASRVQTAKRIGYTALLVLMFLCLIYYAVVWAIRGISFPTAFLVSFLVTSTLEVPFGVVDNGYLLALTALPMAVIVFAPLPPVETELESDISKMIFQLESPLNHR